MKKIVLMAIGLIPLLPIGIFSQNTQDSTGIFKKRALEATELSILTSFYAQDGKNASVTGGIGSEELTDFATDINVSIPVKEDGVLSINGSISVYTSASSSNLDPWFDQDEDKDGEINAGTPWAASSGASHNDAWLNLNVGYNHYSEDRNAIYSVNVSVANEFDYQSFGAGIGLVRLFNQKNTELSVSGNAYFDAWKPQTPIELRTYIAHQGDLDAGLFKGVDILDKNGGVIDKKQQSSDIWKPIKNILLDNKERNTYALSVSFSQVLGESTQVSVFSDFTFQTGWLANPLQRVYFADKANYYIGNAASIPFYTETRNKDVFQLADDIERLPNNRLKIPIGLRLNQYIDENFVLRSYYRYYFDDWGIQSHTFDVELAIKVGQLFTLYPNYRFYDQTAADYFAPFEKLVSTSEYYTSDFDLSKYYANQFGLGIKYTDIFTSAHIWKFGLKNLSLDYNYYKRNTGLSAYIISIGADFVMDE